VLRPEGQRWFGLAHFYGFLLHRDMGSVRQALLNDIAAWCAKHRNQVLPQIVEFEAWASHHYGVDLARIAGAAARRDRLRQLIRAGGDRNLGLLFLRDRPPMTIGQVYSLLYENIEPEARS
jgi:hypothetical protein